MRGLLRPWALLALLLVLGLAPLAVAAPASAELRLQAPLELTGDAALASREGVLVLAAVPALPGSAERLNVTLVRVAQRPEEPDGAAHGPLAPLGLPAGPPLPGLRGARAEDVRHFEMLQPRALTFTTRQAGARALLGVGPYDVGSLALRGPAASVREASPGSAGPLPEPFGADPDARWLAAQGPGLALARGSVRGFFEGLGILLHNDTASLQVDTTDHRDGGHWVALLRWSGARLEASSEQAFALLAPQLDIALEGTLRAARAWGGLTVGEEARAAGGQAVEARGALEGTMAPGGGTLRLRVEGDLAYLALGDERQDYAKAAAAGAGLALLSALAYYIQHLRFLAVPLYARIAPSELLDNGVRRRVLEHVQEHVGADVKDTARAVGVSWSTAAYHLARLEREGVVTSRRAGRSKRFFVNGGAASGRAEAIGALRNPTALAIAELVARRPGLMQKEIGAALRLPPSTVSWHMRRLRALGVVREERRWRRAEYAAGEVWTQLAPAVQQVPA